MWASGPVGERDVLELQRVAQLVESDVRELHHAACICLNSLASADGLHLALPALAALCRALLRCDGSHGPRLQRALSASVFLVKNATDALAAAVAEAGSGDAGGGPTAAAWHALRVHMEAASLAWLQHATPEVVTQAAALLAAFDSPKLRARLPPPPPERSLVAALPDGWGVETNTARAREAQGWAWAAEAEAALRDDFSSFFPPTRARVGPAVAAGAPRPAHAAGHASAAEGIALWRRQLRYLVLHAREPIAAWFPDPSANNAVNHDDVEALFRSLLAWLAPRPGAADRRRGGGGAAGAHDSTLALIVKELKLLAIESGRGGAHKRLLALRAEARRDRHDPRALLQRAHPAGALAALCQDTARRTRRARRLARRDGGRPGRRRRRDDAAGRRRRRVAGPGAARLLATTLEELCSVWLRDQKPLERKAALRGAPRRGAPPGGPPPPSLLPLHCRRRPPPQRRRRRARRRGDAAARPSARPLGEHAAGDAPSERSANPPPRATRRTASSAVTTATTTSRPPARLGGTDPGITNDKFIRRGLALLRSVDGGGDGADAAARPRHPHRLRRRRPRRGRPSIISAPAPVAAPRRQRRPRPDEPRHRRHRRQHAGEHERSGGGGSDTSTAQSRWWISGRADLGRDGVGTAEAVLLAAEALMGTPARRRRDGGRGAHAAAVECLSTPPLQRAACRALAATVS